MQTVVLLITNKEEGFKSVMTMSEAIKAREDANHKLFFTQRLFGTYMICKGEKGADGKAHYTGDREIIFCPAGREEQIGSGKDIVEAKNCMCICGDGEKAQSRLQGYISWLLEEGGMLS